MLPLDVGGAKKKLYATSIQQRHHRHKPSWILFHSLATTRLIPLIRGANRQGGRIECALRRKMRKDKLIVNAKKTKEDRRRTSILREYDDYIHKRTAIVVTIVDVVIACDRNSKPDHAR